MSVRQTGLSEESLQKDLVLQLAFDHRAHDLSVALICQCLLETLKDLLVTAVGVLFLTCDRFAVFVGCQLFRTVKFIIQET